MCVFVRVRLLAVFAVFALDECHYLQSDEERTESLHRCWPLYIYIYMLSLSSRLAWNRVDFGLCHRQLQYIHVQNLESSHNLCSQYILYERAPLLLLLLCPLFHSFIQKPFSFGWIFIILYLFFCPCCYFSCLYSIDMWMCVCVCVLWTNLRRRC